MRPLRDYQQDAVTAIEADWKAGTNRTSIVLATGLGKTDCIADIATRYARDGARVLAMAHRGELLGQIAERCGMHAPEIPVGRVQSTRNQTRRPITVASADTLRRESRRKRLPRPDVVIVDECHHAMSKGQFDALTDFGVFNHVPLLGVTATMSRGDNRGLGDIFQNVAYERGIEWGITHGPISADGLISGPVPDGQGWLVKPHGRVVVAEHMDLENAKTRQGDWQKGELGEMVAQDVEEIVKAWFEHAVDRLTIAFTPDVVSAQALAAEFRRAGVPTDEVYGTTPDAERGSASKGTGIYGRLARGITRVLVSVMVTTEGFDCPPVSCILQCRPTKLPGLYQQMIGRGLRRHPGKEDCLVLDVVGASRAQRLQTLVELHPTAVYDASALPPCEDCGQRPCACEKPERDPDGGRIRLQGPAKYEDLDLFTTSRCTWLFTTRGIRFLPVGKRIVVLWPDSNDPTDDDTTYSVGHMELRGNAVGQELDAGTPHTLDEARLIGERWALEQDASLASRGASWRRGSPSEKQLDFARQLRIPDPELMNRARLSDEISIVLASRRLHR